MPRRVQIKRLWLLLLTPTKPSWGLSALPLIRRKISRPSLSWGAMFLWDIITLSEVPSHHELIAILTKGMIKYAF
jgi:hypothetical protein